MWNITGLNRVEIKMITFLAALAALYLHIGGTHSPFGQLRGIDAAMCAFGQITLGPYLKRFKREQTMYVSEWTVNTLNRFLDAPYKWI